jgi:hypothetical protein
VLSVLDLPRCERFGHGFVELFLVVLCQRADNETIDCEILDVCVAEVLYR